MSESTQFIVTGGAGFIGSNLALALNKRGYDDIIIVDSADDPDKQRNLSRLRYRDVMDKSRFRNAFLAGEIPPTNTVFHIGACSSTTESNARYLEDNNTLYTRQLRMVIAEQYKIYLRIERRNLWRRIAGVFG